MFKNRTVKKILKSTIFPILTGINYLVPKKDNYILLHAANRGISHNLAPLRDYLLNEGYGENNRIYCEIESKDYADPKYDVRYISYFKSIWIFMRSKHVFYTTGQIPIKPSKKQIVIFLDHGTAGYKTFGALSNINNGNEFYFTYYTATSELYIPIVEKALLCKRENIIINDEPVADRLLLSKANYEFERYNKIGLWLPTFRQSSYLGYSDSSEINLLPTITPSDYDELNKHLSERNIKLIVKIHSVQDVASINNNFSNLDIITDEDMKQREWELYDLMAQIDFLISDYSSAYLQFLLKDKPIGFAVPDYEEYQKNRGCVFDNPKDFMPGHFIMNKDDLYSFLNDMSCGKDMYISERKKVCNLIHHYKDGKNCERLVSISKITK